MRLFFANMHRHWGGQAAVVVLLAGELQKRGHDVVVAGVADSEMVKRAAARGLTTRDELELRRGFRPGSFFADQGRLKRFWKDFAPDGILTNGSQDTWTCAIARRRYRPEAFLVRWRHNSFPISGHYFNKWLYRSLIDHVVVSSSEIAPLLTGPGLTTAERITTFPPSTPLDLFVQAKPTSGIRKELGVADDGLLILSVGRLAPEKGHDTLLKAFRQVVDVLPQAKLAIAGLGSQDAKLAAMIKELKLDGHAHLIGFRDDVPALYAECDLAVLAPTGGESFGIALLEAFASGKACVATDVGGVKDLVVDGETGFLVPPGDVDAIAAALIRCCREPDLRTRMAATGKARVLDKFTPAKLADVAEDLFGRLMTQKATRGT